MESKVPVLTDLDPKAQDYVARLDSALDGLFGAEERFIADFETDVKKRFNLGVLKQRLSGVNGVKVKVLDGTDEGMFAERFRVEEELRQQGFHPVLIAESGMDLTIEGTNAAREVHDHLRAMRREMQEVKGKYEDKTIAFSRAKQDFLKAILGLTKVQLLNPREGGRPSEDFHSYLVLGGKVYEFRVAGFGREEFNPRSLGEPWESQTLRAEMFEDKKFLDAFKRDSSRTDAYLATSPTRSKYIPPIALAVSVATEHARRSISYLETKEKR